MMKTSSVFMITIFALVMFAGCYRGHVDLIEQFLIIGQTLDESTNMPLGEVSVTFIDTGYDYKRSKFHHALKIGETDDQGKMHFEFDYWWGKKVGLLLKSKRKERFGIELRREGYATKQVDFKSDELKRENGRLQVPLNSVYLGKGGRP